MPYAPMDTPLKIRQRDRFLGNILGKTDNLTVDSKGKPIVIEGSQQVYPAYGKQITASEGHPWHNKYQGDDIGGPFETTSRYLAYDKWGENPLLLDEIPKHRAETKISTGYPGYRYTGHLLPMSLNSLRWPNPEPSSDYFLTVLGASAIARVKPTNSIADLSVSLAELMREGLPQFPGRSQWKERAQIARGAGSEYLNFQFGWLPLVSEVQNIATIVDRGDKIWKQYERDVGRLVRRRYEFDPVIQDPFVVSTQANSRPFPTPNTYFNTIGWTGGNLVRKRYKRQDRWFSGAFTYYLPDRRSSSAVERFKYTASRARKLYGLTLDPEVLWNLAPWSWAADWFVNTGDVLSNVSDFMTDGLVMPYGYMMETTIVSDEYTLADIPWRLSSGTLPAELQVFCVTKTKKRLGASPYGFGLTWESFSARQVAIMAALGITRR